jgi:glycosyltransferase involved in cell wall biosynthesis
VTSDERTLVLLTIAYPFGRTWEPFLDAELPILAGRFDQIIVMPSHREERARCLPRRVRCETLLADATRGDRVREVLRHPLWLARQYGRALFEEGSPTAYLRHPASYAAVIGTNLLKYRLLRDFVESERLQQAVFYDYWLANSTLALSWLRRRGVVVRAVARAHRFDLYDEQSETGAVPFRAFNVASLDRVVAVSNHGLSYLAERHPTARNLVLGRLGVEPQQQPKPVDSDSRPVIVSCASLKPVKRVELIPQILERVGRPLRWVHFGDGPSRGDVERAAAALPSRVSWHLAGHIEHSELLAYYAANRVDLFISLSASEGLPVSMMEAISFGVPVLATAVEGVPEIVNPSTGALVGVDDSVDSIARAAARLLDGKGPSRDEIVAFFEANFVAEKNFGELADIMRAL